MAENARQRHAFERYFRLGAERSIERLCEVLAAEWPESYGRPPSLRTLCEWSSRYGWQDQLAELERQAAAAEKETLVSAIRQQRKRYQQLGRFLQTTGAKWLQAIDPARVPPGAAIRAITEGVRLEREARPQPERDDVVEVCEIQVSLGGPQELYLYPEDEEPGL